MTIYICDGELVCDSCAVDVTDDDAWIGGESDSPCHCSYCHRPLFDDGAGLTPEGVAYVLQTVRRALQSGTRTPRIGVAVNQGTNTAYSSMVWGHGWYAGLPWLTVTRDWAEYVLDNFFTGRAFIRGKRLTLAIGKTKVTGP